MWQPHLITISDRPLHHLWHKLLQQPAAMSSLMNIDYLHLFSRVHANLRYIAGPAPYQSALWSPASYTQSVARERKKRRPVRERVSQEREGRAMSYMITSCVTQSCRCASEPRAAKWAAQMFCDYDHTQLRSSLDLQIFAKWLQS